MFFQNFLNIPATLLGVYIVWYGGSHDDSKVAWCGVLLVVVVLTVDSVSDTFDSVIMKTIGMISASVVYAAVIGWIGWYLLL